MDVDDAKMELFISLIELYQKSPCNNIKEIRILMQIILKCAEDLESKK